MNTIFDRRFSVGQLTDEMLDRNPWFEDLLKLWYPSGASPSPHPGRTPNHLRLAVRNGYLNFYRAGQSVAKVAFGQDGGLQAKIHGKYVDGAECVLQTYRTLTNAGIKDTEGRLRPYKPDQLQGWIANAYGKSGAEKRFVDFVVGWNPNVIDVEMGLPAYSSVRRAPRMDLVALEPCNEGWRVVFWEAKLADDGRARCSGTALPKVVAQLEDYSDWLSQPGHRDRVRQAYQTNCRVLVSLHELARKVRPEIADLGASIIEVANPEAPLPQIDKFPRLLIDNCMREDGSRDRSFVKNGHFAKLRGSVQCVQLVSELDQMMLEVRP